MNQQKNQQEKKQRKFTGQVVSDKMDKTLVVAVELVKVHPKYGKRFKASRRFKVHDPDNKYQVGDRVEFVETRPLSKEKRWKVI